ncbi:MAG TPA: hypothetical protein VGD54_03670, partial [Steroidobacteraceae bacterium]
TKQQMFKHFAHYFQIAKHSAWEDVTAPVVRVSQDGTTAWAAFNVRSQYVETQPDGTHKPVDTTMSWLSTYEKRQGQWVMTAVATTYPLEDH